VLAVLLGMACMWAAMTYGVVRYTDFMTVGIDYGVLCCEACGALVPFDRRDAHDRFHQEIWAMTVTGGMKR